MTDSQSTSKQKGDIDFFCLFFLSQMYFHTRSLSEKKKNKTLLQLIPKLHAIYHLDTNQKVKICIMDDTDAVNLFSELTLSAWVSSSHWDAQRQAELSGLSCIQDYCSGSLKPPHSDKQKVTASRHQPHQIVQVKLQQLV